MTTCKKFGYSLIYVFHETAVSSPRWKDILSQTQIFRIFPSAIDLVLNQIVKFADRLRDRHVSRQQMWLTNLVRSLAKTVFVWIKGRSFPERPGIDHRWKIQTNNFAI